MGFISLIITNVLHCAEADKCSEATKAYNECSEKAYTTYKKALKKGNDGRPNFEARKSCNYMTEAVENCGDQFNSVCKSEAEVTAEKDTQLARVLKQVKASVEDWDSEKCPAIKAHEDRNAALPN